MADLFSDEADLDDMSINISTKQAARSNVCALLDGDHDSLKSGIAMDCRSKKQIADGAKVGILDFDDANTPLWQEHWGSDPNIVVKNPTMFDTVEEGDGLKKKEIDYERTFARAHAFITNVAVAISEGTEFAGFVCDGLDTILISAETRMREFNDLDVDDGVNFKFWNRRNKYYNELIFAIKDLGCPVYFITHLKEWQKNSKTKTDSRGQPVVEKTWIDGHMEKSTLNKMWQVIDCRQETTPDGISTYYAKVRKHKSRPDLKNQEFVTMKIEEGKVHFYGLPVLRDKVNVEEVDYSDELF